MIVNSNTIEMLDIGRYFIASNMGILMLIGLFISVNTKEDTKYNYLGLFFLFFSMGVFVATGTPQDVLLIGLEEVEEKMKLSFFAEYKFFIIFGLCVILFSFSFLYKFIKANKINHIM